jgi:hypothetical protein
LNLLVPSSCFEEPRTTPTSPQQQAALLRPQPIRERRHQPETRQKSLPSQVLDSLAVIRPVLQRLLLALHLWSATPAWHLQWHQIDLQVFLARTRLVVRSHQT